jgi:competence protein ComEC
MTLHFVDTGQGSCILVECPGGGLILDDCGSLKQTTSPLKTHLYIDRIIHQYTALAPTLVRPLAVIASHPDRDHFDLIASHRYWIYPDYVSRLLIAESLDDYPEDFRAWANRIPAIDTFPPNAHGPLHQLQCGSAEVELLTVNAAEAPRQPSPVSRNNADSVVIAIRYNGFLAVLPGDAEGLTQALVLKNHKGLHPTLLAASHHGADSAGSNDLAWARALQPRIVIFSAARENRFGHPRASSVANYLAQPRLLAARPHQIGFYDDDRTGPIVETVDKAIYATGYAGTLDVTVNAAGGVSVTCAREAADGC